MLREKVEGNPPDIEEPAVSVSTKALEGRGLTDAREAGELPATGFLAGGFSTLVTAGPRRPGVAALDGAGALPPRGS